MKKQIFVSAALVALAACAGGGSGGSSGGSSGGNSGGGGGGSDFSDPQTVAPGGAIPSTDEALQLDGRAVATTFGADGLNAPGQAADAQVLAARDTNGEGPDAFQFTTGGETVGVSLLGDGQPEEQFNGAVEIGGADDAAVILPTDDLDFVAYGGWAETSGPDGQPAPGDAVAFGFFGSPTPAANRPGGDATYSGDSVGITDAGGEIAVTTSDVTVSVTNGFTDVQVVSSNTRRQSPDEGAAIVSDASLDFTASGTVEADGYTAAGDGMNVDGNFFGPAAEETGGAFGGTRNGADYVGSFGAER